MGRLKTPLVFCAGAGAIVPVVRISLREFGGGLPNDSSQFRGLYLSAARIGFGRGDLCGTAVALASNGSP